MTVQNLNITTSAEAANALTSRVLLYAIAQIQSLPVDQREEGLMNVMCALARRKSEGELIDALWSVEHHLGREIDLWPPHGSEDHGGVYSDEQDDFRTFIRNEINVRKARFEETGAAIDPPSTDVITFLNGSEDEA